MKNFLLINLFFYLIISLSFCKEKSKPKIEFTNEDSYSMNKLWFKKQQIAIKKYIERNKINAIKTQTGIWYQIYDSNSNAENIDIGDWISVNYTSYLLDGTPCYDTKESGPQNYKVAGSNIELGLHEIFPLMKVGEKAKIILPAYWAEGLAGDFDKIPMNSVIIVDIKILGVQKKIK